jgi:hypothetical protein
VRRSLASRFALSHAGGATGRVISTVEFFQADPLIHSESV